MEINGVFSKLANKPSAPSDDDDEEIQLSWIKGLIEQVEFANRTDVLPDFILQLKIRKRIKD